MIRVSTGEVVHSYSSASEPGGQVLVPCKNRRKSRCRACAEIYRSDAFQLLKAGLVGGKGVPATVASHPRVFATFTAESFGPVHHRVLAGDGKTVLRCHPHGEHRCRKRHRADDSQLGEPLDPDSYDYVGAMIWNARCSVLWAKTMDLLTRALAARAGCSQRRFRLIGSKTHAKVAEAQARGLIHFHAIIRLDGVDPDDPTAVVPPGSWATVEMLEEAIRAAVARAEVLAADGRRVRWGTQLEVHRITAQGPGEEVSGKAVEGYLAKDACGRVAEYSTKGAEWAGALDRPIWCRNCEGTGRIDASGERTTLDVETGEIGSARHGDASGMPVARADRECERCAGTGMRVKIESLKVSEHVRRMIRTCWDLGGDPRYGSLKLRRWAHQLGYGGHFLSKGRRYSTTFGALRQVRRDFCTAHTLARVGLDRATPVVRLSADGSVEDVDLPAAAVEGDLVVVVGAWRYHSRGHSPGERLWARAVADGIAENRRLAREASWDHQGDDEDWEAA